MKKNILKFLIIITIMFPLITNAETVDTTPPVLNSIRADKTDYNAGDTINLKVDVSDDISGVYVVHINLALKDDINNLSNSIHISKSNLPNGESIFTGEIPVGVKPGKYVLRNIQVGDWAFNTKYFANENFQDTIGTPYEPLPFPNIEININNNITDKNPPVISNIKVNKNQFNVGEKLIVTMNVTDDSSIKGIFLSGDYGWSGFYNTHDNVYQTEVLLKKPGIFKFYAIEVSDIYNNSGRYVYKSGPEIISEKYNIIEDNLLNITVTGEEDKIPPTIKSIEINKKEVKLPSRLEIKVNYNDNKPNDIRMSKIEIYNAKTKARSKINCNEGIRSEDYSQICLINLNQYEELGEYYIGKIYLEDNVNNISEYSYENNTLEYFSFKIIADTNSDNSSSTISNKVDEVILNSKDDAVISIDSTRNNIVKKSIFDNIKGTNKTIIIESGGIQWIFKGSNIVNETKDINTAVNFYKLEEKDNKITNKIKKPTLIISFANNGLLPGKCKVRIKADYALQQYLGKEKLYVYYYDEREEQFSNVASKIHLTSDGYYEFYITHNSSYILTNSKPSEKYIAKADSASTYNNNTKEETNISKENIDISIENEVEDNLEKEKQNENKTNKTESKSGIIMKVFILSAIGIVTIIIILLILFRKKIFKNKKVQK